jgi:phage shock protein PspC (stress-responsive transcriptional regulator)
MKKNISINISGIIFHIEEDGYETLKTYLDSINKYFSTFEDSSEILADIESRIAEIFLSKLNEEKQVITSEDVSALVLTMGSVSDFKASEDQEEPQPSRTESFQSSTGTTGTEGQTSSSSSSSTSSSTSSGSYTPPPSYTPSKQLMRDQKRKILGGVCAGLANYFNVDALWIRLLFAVLTFAYGFTVFVYIIMWIVVPGSYDLDEPIVGKKMFRDGDRKVIGGVSGGIAAYLGIDIIAVRVLFIIFTIAGGLGVFIYIVLWIILPEARTLTDKMQMQGEPVTLSNIESTLKKSQSDGPVEDESTLTRILMFPFRVIGMVLSALGQVLGPLMEVVRVAVGLIITLIGTGLLFGFVIAAGVLFGIFSTTAFSIPAVQELNEASVPVEAFLRAFPGWTAVAAFFTTVVPSVLLILLGISVMAKRIVFNQAVGWTMFVLFFVSVAVLSVSIPKIVMSFKEDAEYRVENVYKVNAKRAVLKINETGMDDYHAVRLELRGHSDTNFRLVQTFEAQGSSRAKAIENAKMVDYNVAFQDSVFTFDSNLKFKDDAVFRAQRLAMTLYIPYNFPFTMDEGISRFITQYVNADYLDGYVWKITDENGLECVNCPKEEEDEIADLRNFEELEITGKFDIRIVRGDDYSVELSGSESAKEKYDIERQGGTLVIDYIGRKKVDWSLKNLNIEEVQITITMPRIEKIEAVGVGTIRMDDFTSDDLDIDLRGPVKLRSELIAHNLTLNLSGSSEADLSGQVSNLNARVELASKLRAYNLEAQDAFIETSGASNAKVNVKGTLEMEEGLSSKIDYRGNPQNVIKRD